MLNCDIQLNIEMILNLKCNYPWPESILVGVCPTPLQADPPIVRTDCKADPLLLHAGNVTCDACWEANPCEQNDRHM